MLFRLGFLANGEAWGRGRGGGRRLLSITLKLTKLHMIMH